MEEEKKLVIPLGIYFGKEEEKKFDLFNIGSKKMPDNKTEWSDSGMYAPVC